MITDAAAKAAGARPRAYKLHDQGGLHLLVRPTGTKSWQQKYRWKGREQLLTLGQFPEVKVGRARILQAEAKARIEQGVDPRSSCGRQQDATFEHVARDWHRHQLDRWSAAHAADVIASLERDAFPGIGAAPIGSIAAPQLLRLLRPVEARGCLETAGRLRQRLSAIFEFAAAQGLVESNPAAYLGRAMAGGKLSTPHAALTELTECRALLAACEGSSARAATVMASRFLALTAVRLAAVRGLRWREIDLEARLWTVPAARMKLSRAKKGEARFDHLVPLSAPAIDLLRRASDLAPSNEAEKPEALVFPGRSGGPIGEGALRDLYARAGFEGRHVPHGWRASFSTILNEDMGEEWRGDIDRALAHATRGKVEAAYNRSVLLDRRRAVFDRWGELIG